MKRLGDVLFAIALILIVCIPLLIILLVTGLVFREKPIFKQTRIGKKNRKFIIYKVKTMKTIRTDHGSLLADKDRMTAYGTFLRSTSLDELPQLWNVLKGDISFVGPRPLLPEYLNEYTAEQLKRHDVLPGITGWAQVNGRNNISWDAKFKLDVWYVNHQSIWLDLKIIGLTFVRVIRRDSVTKTGFVTTEKFQQPSIKQ
ncbi:sugar transferase [Listeria booriae]|uniref:Sugar transferase n=1 Tax=Listeria booriae TaxID=1552123 RepID=A0A7X0WE03_9LIST|nr:sugar transferase [Listeria booriae]MBC1285448.1 sugar transferase [Listeria booriae]MBC1308643.1 sugar transferase [Listeria booriae]MBC1331678.1 sugar transferase [Listeria booriae]MBC2387455.1 sugar transferase [Listeria booriae]